MPGLLPDTTGALFIGLDASVKHDSTALVCIKYDRFTDNLILADHRIWQPSPGAPMDFESTVEFYLRRLQAYNTRIEKVLCDPFQMHRTVTILQNAGGPIEPFPQTHPNLTLATETLYSRLTERRISFYPADDLRQHVLNAASIEKSRGIRLSKEKQTLKIDGTVALSFAVVAAEQSGKPLGPEELRNYQRRGSIINLTRANLFPSRLDTGADAQNLFQHKRAFHEPIRRDGHSRCSAFPFVGETIYERDTKDKRHARKENSRRKI
jgi:hypothetical protein